MKATPRILNAFFLMGAAMLAAACSSGGTNSNNTSNTASTTSTTSTITGSAVKGTLKNSTINFYSLKADGTKDAVIGNATSDNNGKFTISFSGTPSYPILAEATAGSYSDEVTGATVTLTDSDKLTAMPCSATSQTAITPLTHMAATRAQALAKAGTPLATACASSNAGVGQQFKVSDIIKVLAVSASDSTQVSTATQEQRGYGLVMAGIVKEAQTLDVRAIDLVNALSSDLSDGILDGKNTAGAITIPKISGGTVTLTAAMGTTDLQTAINNFIGLSNNKTNLPEKSISTLPVQVGINGAGLFYTTSTVLPAWVSGQAGSSKLAATGGTPPYSCSLKQGSTMPAGFSLSSDCTISGAYTLPSGTTMKITAPFTITMKDSAATPSSKDIEMNITIVQPSPEIATVNGTCEAKKACGITIATASGGTPTYYFMSDSFANGTPPPGTVVATGTSLYNGILTGTPTTAGTYAFGVCAVDLVGAQDCGTTTVTVKEATTTTPPTTNSCSQYTIACGQTNNGIKVAGGVVPSSCSCPAGTTNAGIDNVTPGGPWNICTCN